MSMGQINKRDRALLREVRDDETYDPTTRAFARQLLRVLNVPKPDVDRPNQADAEAFAGELAAEEDAVSLDDLDYVPAYWRGLAKERGQQLRLLTQLEEVLRRNGYRDS